MRLAKSRAAFRQLRRFPPADVALSQSPRMISCDANDRHDGWGARTHSRRAHGCELVAGNPAPRRALNGTGLLHAQRRRRIDTCDTPGGDDRREQSGDA